MPKQVKKPGIYGPTRQFSSSQRVFSSMRRDETTMTTNNGVLAGKRVTGTLTSYLVALSQFDTMQEEVIYEQLYIWEPTVGAAVDRISTLIGQSYQGPYIDEGEGTAAEKECLKQAKAIAKKIRLKDQFEMLGELLMIFGNIFLVREKPGSFNLSVLPNRFITMIPNESYMTQSTAEILTQPNILVYMERESVLGERKLYPKNQYFHIRYKDTQIFARDNMMRTTYGMYSVSPLHRTVLSIWQQRQTQIIDIMWRWRNVPREHHQLDAQMFNLANYDGSATQRRQAAQTDAEARITEYTKMMQEQAPDQGFVTTGIKVDMIGGGSGTKANEYMKTNDLLAQIQQNIFTALNIPSSIINGQQTGSYASELVISNYVSAKVVQLAEKIKYVLLENLKERVKAVKGSLPVDKLDIKIELSMVMSMLEIFRQAAIMKALECFTDDEIRDMVGWEALTDQQKKELAAKLQAQIERQKSLKDVLRDTSSINGPQYPETPQSNEQHKRDPGQTVARKNE